MPRRENTARRRAPRAYHHTVLVYCGAERTEPDYFDGLRRNRRSSGVTIKVRSDGVAPEALVRAAAKHRDRKAGFDEVWCVVDVDQFDIAAAMAEASRRGVSLAVSNPCFELWLLLHHADCRAHCNGYPDVVRRLRRYVPTYDKTELDFEDFAAGIDAAVKRGSQLDPTGVDCQRNPSSGVWRLAERIIGQG